MVNMHVRLHVFWEGKAVGQVHWEVGKSLEPGQRCCQPVALTPALALVVLSCHFVASRPWPTDAQCGPLESDCQGTLDKNAICRGVVFPMQGTRGRMYITRNEGTCRRRFCVRGGRYCHVAIMAIGPAEVG